MKVTLLKRWPCIKAWSNDGQSYEDRHVQYTGHIMASSFNINGSNSWVMEVNGVDTSLMSDADIRLLIKLWS